MTEMKTISARVHFPEKVSDAIEMLRALLEAVPEQYRKVATLVAEEKYVSYDCYGESDSWTEYSIQYQRPETANERECRLDLIAAPARRYAELVERRRIAESPIIKAANLDYMP